MKTIKYIIVAFALLAAPAAQAWNAKSSRSIAELATLHLTPEAKSQVEAILGGSLSKNTSWLARLRKEGQAQHTAQWQSVTVARNLRSMTSDENDAVVQIERATAILRDRANQSDSLVQASLRTVIHLVGDLHCISHIRIEGNDATKGFNYKSWNELTAEGKGFYCSKTYDASWYKLWESRFAGRYNFFTPQYYGDDIDIFANEKKSEYEKGAPRFWVENVGEDVVRALETFQPGAVVPVQMSERQEPVHNRCMAKAAYRLAALLNEIFQ